jgi:hypothetical protein
MPFIDYLNMLTELGDSLEDATYAETQELPSILLNLKAHYRVQNNPPIIPILNKARPAHTTSSYISWIYLNIVHSSTCW